MSIDRCPLLFSFSTLEMKKKKTSTLFSFFCFFKT